LRVFKKLGGTWSLLYIFIVIPSFIRDALYDFIAHNRYRWFGKRNECMLPTEDLKARFLD
jgi:predicted DCC family thiol-disulfide oxidoreductase YuxK